MSEANYDQDVEDDSAITRKNKQVIVPKSSTKQASTSGITFIHTYIVTYIHNIHTYIHTYIHT